MNAIHQRTPARTDRPLRLLSTLGVGLLLVGSGLSRPALGQNLIASDVDQQRHLRTVWSERATGFLEAWTAAEEAERAVGAEALELLRHSSAPKGVWPALPELSGALRVMRGESLDDVRTDPFVRQIDGVDLEVAPGVFPAVLAEEQAPLAVRVYSTGGPRPVLPVELRLTWIAPDGWRMTARRTVVEPRAWIAPGFEVFVIPPGNTPGLWHLEPSILLEGRTLRGQPVPVECVERWDERLTALRGARDARPGSLEPGLALLLYHLELLVSHGLRLPGGLAPSQALALLEAGVRRGPVQAGAPGETGGRTGGEPPVSPGAPRAVPGHVPGLAPGARGAWSWSPSAAPKRVLLVPCGSQEDPAHLLVGPTAPSWFALAESLEAVIVSTAMARQPAEWGELLAATRSAHPGLELIVVARGEAAVRLRLVRMLQAQADWGLAGLVLSGVSAAPMGGPGTGPTLQLGPGLEDSGGPYPESATVGLAGPAGPAAFLAEPTLPEIVAGWIRP